MKQNSLLLKRGIAFLVDLYIGALLGSLPISIISLITIKQMTQNIFLLNHQIAIIAALLSLLLLGFYYLYIPCWIYSGQTLGKRLMDLKINNKGKKFLVKRQLFVLLILTSGGRLVAQLLSLLSGYSLIEISNDITMYLSLISIGMLLLKKIILLFNILRMGFAMTDFGSAQTFVFTILQQPLQSLGGTLPATILVLLVEAVIWCFGLHGSSIVSSVMNPIWFAQSAENLAAFEAGLAMPHIVNYQFISFFVKLGGVGATLSLTLLCLFKAKSDQYRALGKLGIGASLFNINEPIIFGFPIVLNPMMMIPFILANVSVGIVTYLAIYLGLVPMINGINLPYTIPAVISGFMISGWQGALLQVVLLLLTGLIYYPFFKAQDKQAFIEEQAKKEALLD